MDSLISMRITSLIVSLLVSVALWAEDAQKPPVPDPFGLGERLALIDHLREVMGVQPPADATYEQLVALYWKHAKPKQEEGLIEDDALTKDRIRRLRAELKEYDIDAPADASETTLGKLLAEAREAKKNAEVKAVLDKAAERDNPSSPEAAARFAEQDRNAAEARLDSIDGDIRSGQKDLERIDAKRTELLAAGKEAAKKLEFLKNRYEETMAAHNHQVNLYNKKAQEGSTDALLTLEKVHELRKEADERKAAFDAQMDALNKMAAADEALMEQRNRVQEKLTHSNQQRAEAANNIPSSSNAGEATPGGQAEKPATGSQQAKMVAGVVLLAVPGKGSGTGFVVSRDGLIVTNAHVIGSAKAQVSALWDASAGRKPVQLRVVDYAEADDLVLLKAETGAPYEPMAMSEIYELSRPLFSVGFPLAGSVAETLQTSPSDIVLSRGILGSVRRQNDRVEWIQHDCRIASGNSGGPLVDQQTGAVVGVNTMILTAQGLDAAGDGINLAIPIRKVIDRFAQHLKP